MIVQGRPLNLKDGSEWRSGVCQKNRTDKQCELCGFSIKNGDTSYRRGPHHAHAACVEKLSPPPQDERRSSGSPVDMSSFGMDALHRNQRKLEGCLGHEFVDMELERTLVKRFRCIRCGGEVGLLEMRWYERGREHAQRKAVG